jgi:hypothetical protein
MQSLRPNVEQALRSFKKRLLAELGERVRRTVLFGSVARGEARWDSDVDVLVVLDRVEWRDVTRVVDLAADELTDHGVLLSPTVLSVEKLEELKARERRLARDIADEGIPL